ncbi:SRPBCC family protein [Neorhizobium lilium]|uniref:SRPBCC family protein n=1 Tax=Neorhizobium lilium TaxID=2503024 RepID=A0A3S3RUF5_9HYPH|nr:SRPBCC family protein [Neorhizobium lilium]RWX78361.1 SRPBCC family protein [Neorhizobium lilium]
MNVMPAQIIHVSIARTWEDVFAFTGKPENMPLWASGLASGLMRDGEDWLGDGGPIGRIRVRFSPPNPYGILDHTVTMEDDTVVVNSMRVVPNGDGAEIMFTLLQRPDQDNAAFETDAAHVLHDLTMLKSLMERDE